MLDVAVVHDTDLRQTYLTTDSLLKEPVQSVCKVAFTPKVTTTSFVT